MPCREQRRCLEHIPAFLQVMQDEPNKHPGWIKGQMGFHTGTGSVLCKLKGTAGRLDTRTRVYP